MGTLKLAKTKCRWANIWPKDLAWASLMCASDRSRQDDGRVLGQVIYLVIWYFRGGKLKLRQSVTENWKLQTSSNTYQDIWNASFSQPRVWSTWSCIEFLWGICFFFVVTFRFAENAVRCGRVIYPIRFQVKKLRILLKFRKFSKICPKEFVGFFSVYIAVRDKFRIYQLPQVFGWIF